MDSQTTFYIIIVFIVWLLSIPASLKAIKRKGRNSAWIILTIIFLPCFFIIELLSNKSNKDIKLIACEACKQEISSASKTCPHCGHPTPHKATKISLYEWVIGGLIIVVISTGFILKSPMKVLPPCDSSFTQNSAKEAFKIIPIIKQAGVSIININHIETITDSDTEKFCQANIVVSNAQEYRIQYRLKLQDNIIHTNIKILD